MVQTTHLQTDMFSSSASTCSDFETVLVWVRHKDCPLHHLAYHPLTADELPVMMRTGPFSALSLLATTAQTPNHPEK